jgi:uncharacterized protein YhbP (UPF0306 family)
MDLKQLIESYCSDCKVMQLATLDEGKPWICTVYFVHDDQFNLYWMSGRSRQHSREILKNPAVAAAIVKDPVRKQALQIVGSAYEVADDELERVHGLYTVKYGPKDYDLNQIMQRAPDSRAYWMLKPNNIFIWDEVNFPDSPKQKYQVA